MTVIPASEAEKKQVAERLGITVVEHLHVAPEAYGRLCSRRKFIVDSLGRHYFDAQSLMFFVESGDFAGLRYVGFGCHYEHIDRSAVAVEVAVGCFSDIFRGEKSVIRGRIESDYAEASSGLTALSSPIAIGRTERADVTSQTRDVGVRPSMATLAPLRFWNCI